MKLLTPLLVLAAATVSFAAESSTPLRVMSFNVRNSSAQDGVNAWPNRRELLFDTVTRYQPTLIGFQEVLADQHDELRQKFPGYTFVGVAREDGKRKGEWALIGFETRRFDALAQGDFWLSEQPEVPNSKSWDTANTRICTWVRLRDRDSGREFLFANTHFDHKSGLARTHSGRLISARLAELSRGGPVILTGDFNMSEESPAFVPLFKPTTPGGVAFIDSYREVHPVRRPDEASFNGFKGTTVGSRIDFIFHSADFAATAAEIDRTAGPEGRWPSDHYAVTALLGFK